MEAFKKFKSYKKIKQNIKGVRYTLWVADNPSKKSIGLSKIRTLPKNHGMIFVYNKDTNNPFTMKDTYIPLTIIFLDHRHEIVDVFKCKPLDAKLIQPSQNYRYVIEI